MARLKGTIARKKGTKLGPYFKPRSRAVKGIVEDILNGDLAGSALRDILEVDDPKDRAMLKLQLMRFVYPTKIQAVLDDKSDEQQNEIDAVELAEFRAMILSRPKDIECSGRTLPLSLQEVSSQPASPTESLDLKSSSSEEILKK
jgi:hypothetical protein